MTRKTIYLALVLVGFFLIPIVASGDSAGPHDRTVGIDCLDCHPVQQWGIPPRGAEQEALCRSCHNLTGMASSMTEFGNHVVNGGTTLIDCGSCHDVHARRETTDEHSGGTTAENLSLIRADTDKYVLGALTPAVFQQRPQHFAFNAPPYNGICQSCHSVTQHHSKLGVDPLHWAGMLCTACHPHVDNFEPTGGCTSCHNQTQGSRRQIVGTGGDFVKTSHHVAGTAVDDDCNVCHYINDHSSGVVKLYDPDNKQNVISYSPANPAGIETFCINCHDADGASDGFGTQPFSDGRTVPNVKGATGSTWASSAHNLKGYAQNGGNPISCFGNGATTGCHGNAHGSDNLALLSVGGGIKSVDQFCFNCHTNGKVVNHALSDNRPGGYVSADDIQEAFGKSRKHDMGTSFSMNSSTFTLQCTTCHNPHVATGQYWEAELNRSPVTRPDFSDPEKNPRAMGKTLWGASAGQKMDDFAARASGTGGFYYNIARGYQLGATGLPFDQPAVYQPPKAGSGYNFEFDGDVLPDYTTLCLDCHTYRMSAANPPVNWGQGVSCTGNGVDPPDQRVECGAQHGLATANTPSYISDAETGGFWGTNGNPDVLFFMNYVTRGRHNGHFMRWPYDSADRSAGINFVMSCTDCHEAHGSSRGGIVRERFNVTADGDCGTGGSSTTGENCADGGNWNSFCGACHWYYGGQHADMSCGNASCHEVNSLHRIIHTGGGGTTQLMLTAAGYESSYVKPDFTPEIASVSGHTGSNTLTVTFRPSRGSVGIYANPDLTGALTANDFWLFDKNNNNPKTITNVAHVPGSTTATITLSAPLVLADMNADTLVVRPRSMWDWYVGGYVNWDPNNGTLGPQVVSAGPWPVAISGPPPLAIGDAFYAESQIYVFFTEGVYGTGPGGSIAVSDLVLSGCAGRTILGVQHVPGETTATITVSVPLTLSDVGVCTVAPASNRIYNDYGEYASTSPMTLSLSDQCPNGSTSFQFDEDAASPYAFDEQYLFVGSVNDPGQTLTGNGLFTGDGVNNYIYFPAVSCLKATDALTIETRIMPVGIGTATYIGRILARDGTGNYQMSVWRNTSWPTYQPPANVASIAFWVNPVDKHGGDAWKPVLTDYNACPIVSNHWYRVRLVWNSAKASGIPADIYVDDQGTDGNDTGQLWTGCPNCTDSDQSQIPTTKWLYVGDEIWPADGPIAIGANVNILANNLFCGFIDWIVWQDFANYSSVSPPP
ncbi:hypothetical protein HZA56_13650 [Candidatus Poribacteria bacterium]|nr:hypothetical protein [Candidatus Poribacteria bacterium]